MSLRRALARVLASVAVSAIAGSCTPSSPHRPCGPIINPVEYTYPGGDVDILFVLGTSAAMEPARDALRAQLPRLVQILATGDLEAGTSDPGAGERDFSPVQILRVGVTTQDMGGLGRSHVCTSVAGDDGLLAMPEANARRRADAACDPASIAPLIELPFSTDVATFTSALDCQTRIGAGGCGYEQSLEAMLKAVARPDYVPPTGPYLSGTPAHGGYGDNGFPSGGSTLVVVILANSDDGSVSSSDIFDESLSFTPDEPNIRVPLHPEVAYPIERYVDGLRAVAGDHAVVLTLAGVPPDLVDEPEHGEGTTNLDAILADPRMDVRQDPTRTGFLVPACVGATGDAFPARRLVDFTRQTGGIVQSICGDDFGPAIDLLVRRLAPVLDGRCQWSPLTRDAQGLAGCDVWEILPLGVRCGDLDHPEAFTFGGLEADAAGALREVCRVSQVTGADAGRLPGWVYDDGTLGAFSAGLPVGCARRIAFSVITPVAGAWITRSCLREPPGPEVPRELGLPCDPRLTGADDPCTRATPMPGSPYTALICDPFAEGCARPCSTDADCATPSDLPAQTCDQRSASEYFGPTPFTSSFVRTGARHTCTRICDE